MTRGIAIAVDGPAGAGKSTIARSLAARLGYVYLDTGALYRCIALTAQRRGVSQDDAEGLGALARDIAARDAIRFEGDAVAGQRVLLDGEDVTTAIRAPEVGEAASHVSAVRAVREALLGLQRRAADRGGVVLDGRDIGSVVLPNAEAKFFLTASVDVRAERRYRELVLRGQPASLDEVRREVEARDARDTTRPVAPLVQAPDAVLVDSSGMSIDEVVEHMIAHVDRVRAGRA